MYQLDGTDISVHSRKKMAFHESLRRAALCILLGTILWGCATFNPQPIDEVPFRERAETQTEDGVRVTAAVLSAGETEALFGRPLYKRAIQPVWLEIENNSRHRIWFPKMSVDRNYFTPLEVANMYHSPFSK